MYNSLQSFTVEITKLYCTVSWYSYTVSEYNVVNQTDTQWHSASFLHREQLMNALPSSFGLEMFKVQFSCIAQPNQRWWKAGTFNVPQSWGQNKPEPSSPRIGPSSMCWDVCRCSPSKKNPSLRFSPWNCFALACCLSYTKQASQWKTFGAGALSCQVRSVALDGISHKTGGLLQQSARACVWPWSMPRLPGNKKCVRYN